MLEHIKLDHAASAGTAIAAGGATLMGWIPIILGCAASLAAILWIGIQFYWAKKDREAKGK